MTSIEDEEAVLRSVSYGLLCCMLLAWFALNFLKFRAPYGKYGMDKWVELKIPAQVAWVVQESPCLFTAFHSYVTRSRDSEINVMLLSMFVFHYVNRTLVFPFRIRGGKPWDSLVCAMAVSFCSINGFLITRYLMHHAVYPEDWTSSPQFIIGGLLFVIGWAINYHSDDVLRNLRKPGETHYKIPTGGFFQYVSCANYFGEIIEWCGFALATSIPPTACFAIGTMSNLVPRAVSYHAWYREKFEDYPKERCAVIPYIY